MSARLAPEVPVWDWPTRLFHWLLASAFVIAYVTEDDWKTPHVYAGYAVGLLLVWRLLWGFLGPRHARFADFVRTPRAVFTYVRQAARRQAPRYLGHNPAGGIMVVALLVSLAVTVFSGLALYGATDFAGPLAGVWRGEAAADLLKEVHEFGANLVLGLVVLHLGGVVFTSLEQRENLPRAMVTGRKRAPAGEDVA